MPAKEYMYMSAPNTEMSVKARLFMKLLVGPVMVERYSALA